MTDLEFKSQTKQKPSSSFYYISSQTFSMMYFYTEREEKGRESGEGERERKTKGKQESNLEKVKLSILFCRKNV